MPEPLTDRQREVLTILNEAIEQRGVPPTLNEIKERLGISSLRGVTDHLDALERKGWIERTGAKGAARCWRVVGLGDPEEDAPFVVLPVIGAIAAGVPIAAIEHVEDRLAVPLSLAGTGNDCFILRIKGDSMIGDGICDGDLAVLRSQSVARSGDIVAVLLEDEATLKHFVKIGPRIELHASNPAYAPIPIRGEGARIVGKLVGLMRVYD